MMRVPVTRISSSPPPSSALEGVSCACTASGNSNPQAASARKRVDVNFIMELRPSLQKLVDIVCSRVSCYRIYESYRKCLKSPLVLERNHGDRMRWQLQCNLVTARA